MYEDGEIDDDHFHNHYVSAISHVATEKQILPIGDIAKNTRMHSEIANMNRTKDKFLAKLFTSICRESYIRRIIRWKSK